jgi:hypothetical protein
MNAEAPENTPPDPFDLSRPNAARSLAFLAFGAIVGLAIAGYGLFTAQGTATSAVPPEDVALINGRPILRTDYIAQLEAAYYGVTLSTATPEQKQKILEDMIREELFVQRGMELDMPGSDPDTRTALVAAVEQQVAADVTTDKPSDAQLQDYYQHNQAKYSTDGSMTAHDLIMPGAAGQPAKLAAAGEAIAAMRAGTPMRDVMTRYGLKDSGLVNGEEFYFAAKIHLPPPVFAAAQALQSGKVSDAVAAGANLHILVMDKNEPPVALGFDEARERVNNDYKADATTHVEAAAEKFLRTRADIKLAPEFK